MPKKGEKWIRQRMYQIRVINIAATYMHRHVHIHVHVTYTLFLKNKGKLIHKHFWKKKGWIKERKRRLFKATIEPIAFPFCIIPAKTDFLQLFLNSLLQGTIANIKSIILKYLSHIFKEENEKFPTTLCISYWTGRPATSLDRPAKERLMERNKKEPREEVCLHNTQKTNGVAANLLLQVRGQGDIKTFQSSSSQPTGHDSLGVEQPFMGATYYISRTTEIYVTIHKSNHIISYEAATEIIL